MVCRVLPCFYILGDELGTDSTVSLVPPTLCRFLFLPPLSPAILKLVVFNDEATARAHTLAHMHACTHALNVQRPLLSPMLGAPKPSPGECVEGIILRILYKYVK